jgi:hypothetical protein
VNPFGRKRLFPLGACRGAVLRLCPAAAPVRADEATLPPASGTSVESSEQQIDVLARELRTSVEKYGADAVALQAALLVESLRGGAVAASEVGIEGSAPAPHADHLRLRVLSGVVFVEESTSPQSRLEAIWESLVGPALSRMHRFDITPTSLELVVAYGVQDISAIPERKIDPTRAYVEQEVVLRFPASELSAFTSDALTSDELFERIAVEPERPAAARAQAVGDAR